MLFRPIVKPIIRSVQGYLLSGVSSGYNEPLSTPVNVSPEDEEAVSSFRPVFDWEPVIGAETYSIEVARDLDFEDIVYSESDLITSTHTPNSDLLFGSPLYRRVKAFAGEVESEWSEVFSLTFDEDFVVQEALADASGVGMHHKFNATAFQSVGLPISANAAYTAAPGSEIIGDSEFDDLAWWTEFGAGSNSADIAGGVGTITRVDNTAGFIKEDFMTPGVTYAVEMKLNSQTGIFRDATQAGSPIHVERNAAGAATLTYERFASCVANVLRADELFLWQVTTGVTVIDHYRAHLIRDYDLQCSSSGVTLGQNDQHGDANEAVNLDGANNQLFTQRTTLNGMAAFFAQMVINLDTISANDRLLFKNASIDLLLNADGTLSLTINFSGTNATLVTTTVLSIATWYRVAIWIGSDKVPHLSVNGVEATYASQVTGVGTRTSNTNPLYVLSHSTAANSMDGKASDFKLIANALTADIRQLLDDLAA